MQTRGPLLRHGTQWEFLWIRKTPPKAPKRGRGELIIQASTAAEVPLWGDRRSDLTHPMHLKHTWRETIDDRAARRQRRACCSA